MNLSYHKLCFIIIVSLNIPVKSVSLKNLYTCFAPEYTYLSPVHGAAMINSGWLEQFARHIPTQEKIIKNRLYHFTDSKHATALERLVLDEDFGLFNIDPEFDKTTNRARPSFYVTPEIIASLLTLLDCKLFVTSKLSWDKILVPDLFYNEKQELLSEKILENRLKKIMGLKKENIEEFKIILKQITGIIESIKVSKLSIKSILHFIKLIRNAALESLLENRNSIYAPYTTQAILLAFLYKRSITETSDYLQRYITSLQTYKKDIFIKKYVPENFTKFELQKFYTDLQTIEHATNQDIIQFMLHHYELIAQYLHKNQRCPEKVEESLYCYNPQTRCFLSQERPTRPDCTETGILDLISNILYNPETEEYDISLIPSQLQLSSDLINFVKNTTPQMINNLEIRQNWFDLISGHTGKDQWPQLDYVSGTDPKDYELNATLDNILKILNYLFGTSAKNMETLGTLISTDKNSIAFVTKGSNMDQKVIIDIQLRGKIAQMIIDRNQHVSFEIACENPQKLKLNFTGTISPTIFSSSLLLTYEGLYMLLSPEKFTWKNVIIQTNPYTKRGSNNE